jgi:hypothetical protein
MLAIIKQECLKGWLGNEIRPEKIGAIVGIKQNLLGGQKQDGIAQNEEPKTDIPDRVRH